VLGAAVCAACVLVPTASAMAQDYTGTNGPGAGPNAGPGFVPANGTQVLGQQFTRTSSGDFLASTGAEIAELVVIGAGAVAVGTILTRRSRRRAA
jgi:hypothetical protein